MSIDEADRVVRTILSNDVYGGGRFRLLSGEPGFAIVEGSIYRYHLLSDQDRRVALTVYLGLGEMGGRLWEQELRVLQHIGSLGHPALPVLEGGGYVRAEDFESDARATGAGFIRTAVHNSSADGPREMAEYFATDRVDAIRALGLLADALAALHDSRIAHRNLWPGTLESYPLEEDEGYRVLLARFEMSTMVSNLLRGRQVDRAGAAQVRPLYLGQHPRFLAYCPPERIDFLTGATDTGAGDAAGDVFGLAVIAAEWLLGPELLDDHPVLAPGASDPVLRTEHREFHRRIRAQVRTASSLPPALAELLGRMLEPVAGGRPTAAEVTSELSKQHSALLSHYSPDEGTGLPYLVAYMRKDSDRTLFKWKCLSESAMTDEGKAQLVDLIENDLREASVCYSEQGAAPFIGNAAKETLEQAKDVLFGKDFVWFATTLFHRRMGGKEYHEKIKVIKHVLERSKAPRALHDLHDNSLRGKVFAVEALDHLTDSAELKLKSEGRPDWKALVRGTAQLRPRTRAQQHYLDALDWFVQYQSATLQAREYAYVLEDNGGAATKAVLRWDRDRDRKRAYRSSAMQAKIFGDPLLRASMADFFAEVTADDLEGSQIQVRGERESGSAKTEVGAFRLAGVRNEDTVVLELVDQVQLPERGWLRLKKDTIVRRNLQNQIKAVEELANNPVLLQSLIRPLGLLGDPRRWVEAGTGLQGEGGEAVRAMLEHEAMFAVQGPPGTGKTEVTSQAVAAYLQDDPYARVLVSAQSHDALDNLASRVLRKIGTVDDRGEPAHTQWLALRVASKFTERNVAKPVDQFLADQALSRMQDGIRSKIVSGETAQVDSPGVRKIVQDWLGALPNSGPELRARLRRGANVVFATTGASTAERLVQEGTAEPFDWVVVEEAAKAWPTELALPLVRGTRWTLIGDQAQIGAFARSDVERFLDSCHEDPDPIVAGWWEARKGFMDVFSTFGSLFADDRSDAPRLELTEQRRMRGPIAKAVSAGFYSRLGAGGLKTVRADSDHGLEHPGWLVSRPLVWVDTGETQKATGFWSNPVEADVVAALVRSFRPAPVAVNGEGRALAIITPYNRQVQAIRDRLPAGHADSVWSVDSFQGREARIVVASLVRDRDGEEAHRVLGHVADPARANVLLSRARDLLVVVGRIARYERCGVPEWESAVAAIREHGLVVPMSRVVRP
ncbi:MULTISPECIES: AAA domain-containing protein [Actinosynnema]|uniref:AAA domain-containing protein n=1 Tax=Actinosynnema TaxID=40566 RepID=UPI0020A55DA2|nr:AAA domain-containing protein [Actinosynnema pretiosum]MCP2094430.1 regulator of nonsense transcripts 1 [Actinosynnema pretiosum]